jgi:hypothetical protein
VVARLIYFYQRAAGYVQLVLHHASTGHGRRVQEALDGEHLNFQIAAAAAK